MTAARSDSVAVFEVQARSENLTTHSSSWAANFDITIARPSLSESLGLQ